MRSSSQCATQTLTFPKTEDWHAFAAANGIEQGFYLGSATKPAEQPSTGFVVSLNREVCAVALLFTDTRECGLWVAASRRGHGYGRQALARLLVHNTTQLYGTVSQDNPYVGTMEHLFNAFGFECVGKVLGYKIWQFLPKREQHLAV